MSTFLSPGLSNSLNMLWRGGTGSTLELGSDRPGRRGTCWWSVRTSVPPPFDRHGPRTSLCLREDFHVYSGRVDPSSGVVTHRRRTPVRSDRSGPLGRRENDESHLVRWRVRSGDFSSRERKDLGRKWGRLRRGRRILCDFSDCETESFTGVRDATDRGRDSRGSLPVVVDRGRDPSREFLCLV